MSDRTTVTIPADLRAEARELDLNISDICRDAVRRAVAGSDLSDPELEKAYTEGTQAIIKRNAKQVDAGYALVHALLHDPAFDALRTTNQLTAQTVKALNKARKAYGS